MRQRQERKQIAFVLIFKRVQAFQIYIYISVFLLSVRPNNKDIKTKNVDHLLWRNFDKCIYFDAKYVNLMV